MWGICQDVSLYQENLYGYVVEYQITDRNTAAILQPVSGTETDIRNIQPLQTPPRFRYGDAAAPVRHPEQTGSIREIRWHFRNNAYYFILTVNNKRISKRYYEEDLIPV